LTTSIAVSRPHAQPLPHLSPRPVLRRLVDILPRVAPVLPDPPPAAPPAADPGASVVAERVLRRLVAVEQHRGKQHQIRSIIQMQARLAATALRGMRPYRSFSFKW